MKEYHRLLACFRIGYCVEYVFIRVIPCSFSMRRRMHLLIQRANCMRSPAMRSGNQVGLKAYVDQTESAGSAESIF